jgi:putative acetyltransferase
MHAAVSIEPICDDQRDAFAAIWIPWLRDTMKRSPESEDLAIMANPAAYYRSHGGDVFLAFIEHQVVGAVAVKKLGPSGFEFCKLVVTEAARGHGVGRGLVEHCLRFAADHGGPALFLQSFRALNVAVGLYERMGFLEVPAPAGMSVLARTEIIMAKAVL